MQKAALYDPPGVGGTHVMYVLQHGDQPELYSGLPADPKISPLVSLWKGVAKPLAVDRHRPRGARRLHPLREGAAPRKRMTKETRHERRDEERTTVAALHGQ